MRIQVTQRVVVRVLQYVFDSNYSGKVNLFIFLVFSTKAQVLLDRCRVEESRLLCQSLAGTSRRTAKCLQVKGEPGPSSTNPC